MTVESFAGFCSECGHWMWTKRPSDIGSHGPEHIGGWVHIRCADCGDITLGTKGGELGRTRTWHSAGQDLVVNGDREDVIRFDDVAQDND